MNWIAFLVAALIPLVVGFAWYHPKVLGAAWQKAAGLSDEDIAGGNMPLIFGIAFVLAFFAAVFISFAVSHGHDDQAFNTFKHGAFHGALTGIMIALPVLATNALFERKSWTYIGINVGYWIVSFALMGGVLAVLCG